MKRQFLFVLAICMAGGVALAAQLDFLPWFNQDYDDFVPATWTDKKGEWTRSASDRSVFDSATHTIALNTGGGELAFAPVVPSKASAPAAVDVQMMFSAVVPSGSLVDADADSQASLVLCESANGFVFSGWTGAGWKPLAATGVVPATNIAYNVRVEIDYAYTPARVRYLVSGNPLADGNGNAWFAAASGSKKQVSKICFTGRGEVGAFSGEHKPSSAFTLDSVKAVPGEPVSVQVTTNAAPRGAVTYKWYSGGRNKSWESTPFSTSPAPVFDAARCANWVRVVAEDEDGFLGEKVFFYSRLPVAYIAIKDGKTPSSSKEEHDGTLYLQGNARYSDQYDGAMKIHVRGNSTSGHPKKPWKLKLDKKTDMFGFGKNKHWVMLSNYLDVGLMRNTIAYDLSGELGLVNMKTTWVDVILNGSYQGCYQFCEHIRISDGRVNIYDWEDAAEKLAGKFADKNKLNKEQEDELVDRLQTDFSWVTSNEVSYNGVTAQASSVWKKYSNDVTGGYLFELSHEYDEPAKFTIATNKLSLKVMLNSPERLDTNQDMMNYCRTLWTDVVQAWMSPAGVTPDGRSWADLCNADAMAAYWLTMEITGNNDAVYKSRYAWKDLGGPLTFGPAWDFDWGCGSPVVGGTGTSVTGWRIVKSGNEANFYREWGDDPYFALVLWEKYRSIRGYLARLLEDGGIYDRSLEYIYESGMADSVKWYSSTSQRNGYTFDVDSAWFKQYLQGRVAWIDLQFANVKTLMESIKTSNSASAYTRCAVEKLNPSFAGSVPNPRSFETGVTDVLVPMTSSVRVDITSTSTAMRTLAVRVNGRVIESVSVAPIASGSTGTFTFELPAESFLDEGRRNMVDFIAYRSTGEVVYRTWALVTRSRGLRIFIR